MLPEADSFYVLLTIVDTQIKTNITNKGYTYTTFSLLLLFLSST